MINSLNHLKTKRFSLRILVASTIFLAAFASGASSALAGSDLTVRINTDSDVYQVGDPVKVTYTVDNETDQTIHIEGTGCTPVFKLIVFDGDENEIWNSDQCPVICCTCGLCPIAIAPRDIPPGETVYEDDVLWHQVQITGRDRCGCLTEQVKPGSYFLVGQVIDTQSDSILIQIVE